MLIAGDAKAGARVPETAGAGLLGSVQCPGSAVAVMDGWHRISGVHALPVNQAGPGLCHMRCLPEGEQPGSPAGVGWALQSVSVSGPIPIHHAPPTRRDRYGYRVTIPGCRVRWKEKCANLHIFHRV